MFGSIMVVRLLIVCIVSLRVCSLIWEVIFYNNTTKASKNICYAKGEDAIDHCITSQLFQKCYSGKNLDNQARSSRPKTMNSKTMRQIQWVALSEYQASLAYQSFTNSANASGLVRFVGFYGISTFVGYLMPNPFLCK